MCTAQQNCEQANNCCPNWCSYLRFYVTNESVLVANVSLTTLRHALLRRMKLCSNSLIIRFCKADLTRLGTALFYFVYYCLNPRVASHVSSSYTATAPRGTTHGAHVIEEIRVVVSYFRR